MTRPTLDDLDAVHFDVVIVGAGAVGCATARELAGRGYRTLLVDRGDIASGTSARSSRMLYSGLGYLAARYPLWQMALRPRDMLQRLHYTRQVMRCRAELVQSMPGHLTRHDFHYPFRRGDRYPAWLVDLGFKLVEALGDRFERRLIAQENAQPLLQLGCRPVQRIGGLDAGAHLVALRLGREKQQHRGAGLQDVAVLLQAFGEHDGLVVARRVRQAEDAHLVAGLGAPLHARHHGCRDLARGGTRAVDLPLQGHPRLVVEPASQPAGRDPRSVPDRMAAAVEADPVYRTRLPGRGPRPQPAERVS